LIINRTRLLRNTLWSISCFVETFLWITPDVLGYYFEICDIILNCTTRIASP